MSDFLRVAKLLVEGDVVGFPNPGTREHFVRLATKHLEALKRGNVDMKSGYRSNHLESIYRHYGDEVGDFLKDNPDKIDFLSQARFDNDGNFAPYKGIYK